VLVHSSIPSPDWQSFNLTQWFSDVGLTFLVTGNPIVIHAYALCILLGIVLATILTSRRLTNRGAEPGVVLDIILWAIPFGIIGARIYHVLTHPGDYFYPGADLLRTLYIWEGGIAIFGALLGGAVGAYIGCRLAGVRFWAFADALAPGMLLAQAAGRLGNYFNHELFGTPTNLPWGLEIEPTNPAFPIGLPAGTLFQPTFLYEILWNLLGVLVILGLERAFRLQWGKSFAVYLIWYGVGRAMWETMRVDPSEIFLGVRTNVWGAWAAILIGIIIIIVQSRRHPGLEISPYRSGSEWVPPGSEVESGDTYSDEELRGNDASETAKSASESESLEPNATSTVGAKA
jgi:prolipoprotein diacylglyceryl transferase